jgi:4-hydroxy-tetrahydrodipicolinate synthase
MSAKMFRGVGVALVTPFHTDGSIDFESLKKLVQFVSNNGVNYLVALGTTGETPTMSTAEKISVLECITETNAGKLPLVCGIGGSNTSEVIENIKSFPLATVDAILSVSPYYNKPSQEGIFQHFKAISDASPLPIILYNVPGRTGSNMLPATVLRIASACPNVIAIKEASGNIAQNMEIINNKPKNFMVLSGDDDIVLSQIAVGVEGVISVAANAFPKIFSTMVQHALNNDAAAARPLHYSLLPGIGLLFAEGNPVGVKCALSKLGICENNFRLPIVKASADLDKKMGDFISGLK